ncbi:hypothetical protein AMK08_PB00016 (plasmid) [Rhizobium sp. N4311]|nr:hypothetical protein AMK08_PB00016 [Rhizobium sp. N4311]
MICLWRPCRDAAGAPPIRRAFHAATCPGRSRQMDIRMATPGEDDILVGHYLKIWDSYGTLSEHYRPDAAAWICLSSEPGARSGV